MKELTVEELVDSFGYIKGMKEMLEDYRLESWFVKGERMYIVDRATISGLAISSRGEVELYLSGVEYHIYYGERMTLDLSTNLFSLLSTLYLKERINKDRFSNMEIFFEDVRLRLGK